ncbi:hypothetical protein AgCh_027838 [Apium graveolens]
MSAKKRGRPLKISKSETKNKEEAENFDDGENMNGVLSENTNTESGVESGRKRGRASEINGNNGTVEDESGSEIKIHGNDSVKPVGFRQNGSRRKNKPQRAAENNNAGSGYSTPEVAMSAQYTIKKDVYSFGVSMLELLSGRKSFDSSRPRSEQSFIRRATLQLHDIDVLAKMVDPALNGL